MHLSKLRVVSSSNNISFEETEEILEMMGDPIKFSILLELFRRPNSSPLEIKKRLGIKGSRIYYYLNPLREAGLIEETETEEITSHLSRSKFKASNKFSQAINVMRHDPKFGHRKAFHTFQLNFAISLLQQQLRTLEKIPEEQFDAHVDEQALPHRQFFFVNDETLNLIKEKHEALSKVMAEAQSKQGGLIQMMTQSDYVALFGIYELE